LHGVDDIAVTFESHYVLALLEGENLNVGVLAGGAGCEEVISHKDCSKASKFL
jgi:hypothetical protein